MRTAPLFGLLLLAACVPPQPMFDWPREPLTPDERADLFANVEAAHDDTYGYTLEHAVRIGRYGPFKGMQASAEMISHLRKDGRPLRVLGRFSRHTARPVPPVASPGPYGTSREETIVDVYTAVTANGDTLRLYFDPYYSAPLRVPQGLDWSATP